MKTFAITIMANIPVGGTFPIEAETEAEAIEKAKILMGLNEEGENREDENFIMDVITEFRETISFENIQGYEFERDLEIEAEWEEEAETDANTKIYPDEVP